MNNTIMRKIKLGFRINDIFFGSIHKDSELMRSVLGLCTMHTISIYMAMLVLLLHFPLPPTLCDFSFNNNSLFSQIYLK